jgi:hypothetical protein
MNAKYAVNKIFFNYDQLLIIFFFYLSDTEEKI